MKVEELKVGMNVNVRYGTGWFHGWNGTVVLLSDERALVVLDNGESIHADRKTLRPVPLLDHIIRED